jgi:tRNA 2-selenouridine synthase
LVSILKIDEFWKERNDRVLFDVRTPAEYEKGHVPKALNLPLFSNEERAIVGTIYKQESPEKALLKGLDFVGIKMSDFVIKTKELAPQKKIIIQCWRGGKRSGRMAWLLELAGFDVKVLEGGYKAYKNHMRNEIQINNFNFVIVGGRTGSGKTQILRSLEEKGEQVIDLEKLAHHKGSAFGWLGEKAQPNSDQFENDLFEQLLKLDVAKRIWLENESRNIGSVYLPDTFWDQMKKSPVINIEIPFNERVQILVDEYSQFPKEELLTSFNKIKKRLGGQNLKEAESALNENNFHKAAEIALKYYDKSYQFLLENNKAPEIHMLSFDTFDPMENAVSLMEFYDSLSLRLSKINI